MVGRRRWWASVVITGAMRRSAPQRLSAPRLSQLGAGIMIPRGSAGTIFERRHSRRRYGVSAAATGARRSFGITTAPFRRRQSIVLVQRRSDGTQRTAAGAAIGRWTQRAPLVIRSATSTPAAGAEPPLLPSASAGAAASAIARTPVT